MTDKDPLDDFFDNLSDNEVKNTGEFSSNSDHEDTTIKSRAFILPDNPEYQENDKDCNDNEPEYVLAPDHSKIKYPPYQRNIIFSEFKESMELTDSDEAKNFQEEYDITIFNNNTLPLLSFDCFVKKYPNLETFFSKLSITKPTPVQAQTIPIALHGYDLNVVSPTGTGKTLSFLLPLLVHITTQGHKDGPVSLILSPTEILARQTAIVLKHMTDGLDVNVVELTGSSMKHKQSNAIEKGADVVIATPGRLIKFLKTVDWRFCTFLVIDEADRIFETGFFRQLRSIADYIRPDRQTLLFGATLPRQIEELTTNSLSHSVRVQIGRTGALQSQIEHNFVILDSPPQKREWLKENILKIEGGLTLLFVKDKFFCETLYGILKKICNIGLFHGQMSSADREESLAKFKRGETKFLIATEVAARGIDIPEISTVVNVDVPETPQSYVHRVGRTGRAGRDGTAYTLLTPRDSEFANKLLHHFLLTGVEPPENLIEFVEKNQPDDGPNDSDSDF